jgi:hypothetical protein
MAEITGIIKRSIKNISAPGITGATDTRDGLTMVADGMSPHGTVTKNTMIVIGRLPEPKYTLLSIITNITDRFINSGITINTVIKQFTDITISINHPTMYFLIGHRSTIRDGRSPSRPEAGGKLNKSVRRYIISSETVLGSGFRVQRLQQMISVITLIKIWKTRRAILSKMSL